MGVHPLRKKEVAMIPTVLLFNVDADKGRRIKAFDNLEWLQED